MPRHKDYGAYPGNTRFEACVSATQEDLAEFVSAERFFYSGTTATQPPAPQKLTELRAMAIPASSTIPAWGAYFLDSP